MEACTTREARQFAWTYLKTMDAQKAAAAAGRKDGGVMLGLERVRKELEQLRRAMDGQLKRQDVARRLAELAYGPANDCVRLVLEPQPELEQLDLSLLKQVRRSERGALEVELVDRLAALRLLSELLGGGASAEGAEFLAALGAADG